MIGIKEECSAMEELKGLGRMLREKQTFSFDDQEQILKTCGKLFDKIKELELSRDNWKEKARKKDG